MHHHGKGVYSGTFSGTLNPALQDANGQPKRDITTIVHILNDLLCAQYKAYSNSSSSRSSKHGHHRDSAKSAQASDNKTSPFGNLRQIYLKIQTSVLTNPSFQIVSRMHQKDNCTKNNSMLQGIKLKHWEGSWRKEKQSVRQGDKQRPELHHTAQHGLSNRKPSQGIVIQGKMVNILSSLNLNQWQLEIPSRDS